MDRGSTIQCKPIIPACGEVPDLDLLVAGCLPLTPKKETFFGTKTLFVDVANCEPENKSPYQTQYDFAIPIYYVLGANIGHLYASSLDKVQAFVDILESLDAQLWF